MQFTIEFNVSLPRDLVVELFTDLDNNLVWMPKMIRWEALKGQPYTDSAKVLEVMLIGNREHKITETYFDCHLPDSYCSNFDDQYSQGICKTTFVIAGNEETRIIIDYEMQYKGLQRFLMPLFTGYFKAQTQNNLLEFKVFAEKQPKLEF